MVGIYLGNYKEDATALNFKHTTKNAAEVPFTLAGSPVITVYRGSSTANKIDSSGAAISIVVDHDGNAGQLNVLIDLSADALFIVDRDYSVVVTTGTVDGVSYVGTVIAHFSIQNRFEEVDVTRISGDTIAADNMEKEYDGTGFGMVLLRTTINVLTLQTSFTLPSGSIDDDAYNECIIVVESATSTVQKAVGIISNYEGVSRTTTLASDPGVFVMASGDIVTILASNRAIRPAVQGNTFNITGAGMTALGGMSSTMQNQVNAEVDTALNTVVPASPTADSINDVIQNLTASAGTLVTGAAEAGTLSTTQMTTDLTEATDDHFNGRVIIWTSGVLQNQATKITDYAGANGLFTYTSITEAPSVGDTFVIV